MTTMTDEQVRPVDTALVARAVELRERAERLRTQAERLAERPVDALLADTYRRRAAELELEAWASEVRAGLPLDGIHALAA